MCVDLNIINCAALEIRQKFFNLVGHVPANVAIMTWFSFLITHGVKPFQGGLFDFPVTGMLLVQAQSGIRFHNSRGVAVPWPEDEIDKHFFLTRQDESFRTSCPSL